MALHDLHTHHLYIYIICSSHHARCDGFLIRWRRRILWMSKCDQRIHPTYTIKLSELSDLDCCKSRRLQYEKCPLSIAIS